MAPRYGLPSGYYLVASMCGVPARAIRGCYLGMAYQKGLLVDGTKVTLFLYLI